MLRYLIIFLILMNINTFKIFASKLGSYLFCVNIHNSNVWKWAPASPFGIPNFDKLGSSPNTKGTWINGTGAHNKHYHPVFNVVQTFNNIEEAITFCQELKKICTNAFGEEFSHVGVATWAVTYSTWAYIQVFYLDGTTNKRNFLGSFMKHSRYCSNWNYSDL